MTSFEDIYREGECLRETIDEYLSAWPTRNGHRTAPEQLDTKVIVKGDEIRDQLFRWFNLITLHVLPYTSFHRDYVNRLLRRVTAATASSKYHEEYHFSGFAYSLRNQPPPRIEHNVDVPVNLDAAKKEASDAMNAALRLVRTALPADSAVATSQSLISGHVRNTAFILMWMDKDRPELVDVHETVKDVFSQFGITAHRADEVEHQERITDVVLAHIAQSQFLFADLSGERPNVYYEVGYAHALSKHPILYRRAGTPLHFDLSVHNVPEYENLTQLRKSLTQRLAAITGRDPKGGA
ncbi:MAG: hypothetical protein DMF56_13355 [Acidobacteria bacterium]|nr:MAG: hypothetical protein DMF56_13355 [Acidobacteriota bacterium]